MLNNNLYVGRYLIDVSKKGGGGPKGSATAANLPADPKTLCFVRRELDSTIKND